VSLSKTQLCKWDKEEHCADQPRQFTLPHDEHMQYLHASIICVKPYAKCKCESVQWVGVKNSSPPSLSSLLKPCFPFIQCLTSVSLRHRSLAFHSSSVSASCLCLALSLSCTSLASLWSAILPWLAMCLEVWITVQWNTIFYHCLIWIYGIWTHVCYNSIVSCR